MIRDILAEGVRGGWDVRDASKLEKELALEGDVVIVGTGAGGGISAEIFANADMHVILIEEGPLKTSSDFKMLEREAYPQLYQESAGRRTKDKGIIILQGRSVGGSTTVNWTTSFRTPPSTLRYWREHFGLESFTPEALAPWFAMMERRLHITRWNEPPNENNAILARGAAKLGIETGIISRNVTGCYNLGYCGLGCPTNAKQSMLVTTIPTALERGATLVTHARAERFEMRGDRIIALHCRALDAQGVQTLPTRITVRAKIFVAAGGAINTPALLLRSRLPDPHERIGKRTFLHPSVISAAVMPEDVLGYQGAPQSVYSDHFLRTQAIDAQIGYKLEVPPLHPVLTASTLPGIGEASARMLANFARTQAIIALMRDGFHEESVGGSVGLKSDNSPLLDYPVTPYVWDGMRRAFLTMANIQFAAGATAVLPLHESARPYGSWDEARREIESLPMEILLTRIASAHVMGGCGFGADPATSVVDPDGRFHHLANLFVFDGATFPTSLGANPQLSIYGIVARNATRLAKTFA